MARKVKIEYNGSTKGGIFKMTNRNKFVSDVLRAFPECNVLITVTKRKVTRSLSQNNWYWACVVGEVRQSFIDAGNVGLTIDDVHHFLKDKFNPKMAHNANGEFVQMGSSTTILSKSEFADYTAQIKAWAREFHNIEIPEPESQIQIEFE